MNSHNYSLKIIKYGINIKKMHRRYVLPPFSVRNSFKGAFGAALEAPSEKTDPSSGRSPSQKTFPTYIKGVTIYGEIMHHKEEAFVSMSSVK